MDGNELRPLQAPLKKRYREQFRWDSEFESGFLQRGVTNEPRGCSKQRRARTVERTRSSRSNPSPSTSES